MPARDRWPFRRQDPPPPAAIPSPLIDPAAWDRSTPVEGWMTVPTDPRMPTPLYPDAQEEPPMTQADNDTEQFEPVTDVPEFPTPQREVCVHCGGTGHAPTVNDYLRESLDLVAPHADGIVMDFYRRLFAMTEPELDDDGAFTGVNLPLIPREIFPPDLLHADAGPGSRGLRQRDELVKALKATAKLYDPFDRLSMQALYAALEIYGRRHVAFAIPGGEGEEDQVFVPQRKHYDAVEEALKGALVAAAEGRWRHVYTLAWSEALEKVSDATRVFAQMAALSSGNVRTPRMTAEPVVARPPTVRPRD